MRSSYPVRFLIAVDQLVNVICGGDPDETLSARSWRSRDTKWHWRIARVVIDWLFFFEEDHCKKSYESEVLNKHLASVYTEEQTRLRDVQ